MKHRTIAFALVLALTACSSSQDAEDLADMRSEITRTREAIHALEASLQRLETRVVAANPEGDYTTMTIDGARWSKNATDLGIPVDGHPFVLCHVMEWGGYGKMLRFTCLADSSFWLEADGRQPVEATMGTGGITNESGSVRYVHLHPQTPLEPNISYRLRARNQSDPYRWSVAAGVTIVPN